MGPPTSRSKTVPSMAEDDRAAFEADCRSFTIHETLDELANYAARGRKFESLSDDQLTDHFGETFRKLADDPAKWEYRALTKDLVAEFQMRNIEPPYDLVSEEFDRVCEAVLRHLDRMKKEDPDRYAEMNREVARDFARFLSERDRSN
jgi:hypothetical protein